MIVFVLGLIALVLRVSCLASLGLGLERDSQDKGTQFSDKDYHKTKAMTTRAQEKKEEKKRQSRTNLVGLLQ